MCLVSRGKRQPFPFIFLSSKKQNFAREYPVATPKEFVVPCEKNSLPLKLSFHFFLSFPQEYVS